MKAPGNKRESRFEREGESQVGEAEPNRLSDATLKSGNNFNLIRLILACLVIVSHSYELIDGSRLREPLHWLGGKTSAADVAVSGFFVLSGFLICMSWLKSPRSVRYWRNRLGRIAPGFIACVAISVVLYAIVFDSMYVSRIDWKSFVTKLMLFSAGGLPEAFSGSHFPALNQSLWTIHYEFLCYGGLFLLGVSRLLHNRLVVPLLVCLIGLELGLRSGIGDARSWAFADQLSANYYVRNCIRFAICYLCGIAWALNEPRVRAVTRKMWPAFLVGFVVSIASPSWCMIGTAMMLVPLLCLLGQMVPVLGGPWMTEDISYGVYLYAWPIQKTLLALFFGRISPVLLIVLTVGLAFLAGWISWRLVEAPVINRFRKQDTARFVLAS